MMWHNNHVIPSLPCVLGLELGLGLGLGLRLGLGLDVGLGSCMDVIRG